VSKLFGKTVLVAGTSLSMVRATALGLAAAGGQMLIQHGGDAKRAETIVEQLRKVGARAGAVSADLADLPSLVLVAAADTASVVRQGAWSSSTMSGRQSPLSRPMTYVPLPALLCG
jgi:NAD(P)-dependent dehydrogenase (short-subunit alcohol dehydrogenase family)